MVGKSKAWLMTGVTFIGARDQIAKQLVSKGTFDQKDVFPVSTYIARTVSREFYVADDRFYPVSVICLAVQRISWNG
jgi:hypothetical protein